MRNKFFYILTYCLFITSCFVFNHSQKNENAALIRGKTGSGEDYISYLFDNDKKIIFTASKDIYPFQGGYTVASDGYNTIALDNHGNELFRYKIFPVYVWFYSEGYFTRFDEKKDGGSYYVNFKNKRINLQAAHPVKNGYCAQYNLKNKKMYYQRPEGKCLKTKNGDIYYSEYCGDFSNGYAVVGENDLYGIINISAEEIVNKNFSFIGNLKYEYATASIKGTEEKYKHRTDPEYGLIDMHGNWIVKPNYYQIMAISSENAVIKTTPNNNKENCGWGVIHLKDKTVTYYEKIIDLQSDFENGEIFFDKSAIFCYSNNFDKFGIINDEGKIILNAICEKIEPFPDNGYWQVLINDKWMLFKEDEGILDPEKYLDFGKVK
ncbi:WG repeat-containing protein [Treponema socranskii]|uniref:WG repeat-containing protein n=1 Tax=Treponema socranskii TaxID=53419 RepID=UPI0028E7D3A6|nr:WG repeat-containing protein [Treponema socranskii]